VAPFIPVVLAVGMQTAGVLGPGSTATSPGKGAAAATSTQTGEPFDAGCAYPFADIAVKHPIDLECGISGKPADAPNQAQNEAKNNFCVSGDAVSVTPADLVKLQGAVKAANIPFGDTHHLPPKRSVLRNLSKTDKGVAIGEGSKVRLVAFVEQAHPSDVDSGESVNCDISGEETNDIHIPLVQAAGTDECTSVTAEMSPHGRPAGWTSAALNLPGQVVRVTGQLFFDGSHRPCAGGKGSPKRASLWEVHPVYAVDVCTGKTIADCPVDDDSKWRSLEPKPGEAAAP
jgi:hypothetical protein